VKGSVSNRDTTERFGALTICNPPGYHFQIMTRHRSNFVFLTQTHAGRVSSFNKPDRSAGWHRAE